MMTVIEKLRDLHEQATNERSHFYAASVIREAIAEIERLNTGIASAANAITDSISVSGNYPATNLHFVKKLRDLKSP